jgi:biotin carboxylase
VLKPFASCASRGVSIVSRAEAIEAALAKARAYGETALLEEGLRGSEHSVEGLFAADGAVVFFNIVDRLFSYDQGIALELGHLNPSRLPASDWQAMRLAWEAAAAALGVRWGPFKCDMIQTAAGPKILECTARLSGGWDCQATTPFSSGRRPMQTVLELACGRPLSHDALEGWTMGRGGAAACVAAFPTPGRVRAVDQGRLHGLQATCAQVVLTVSPGSLIPPYTHCATRPGFAICVHPDAAVALTHAVEAAQQLAAALEMEPR